MRNYAELCPPMARPVRSAGNMGEEWGGVKPGRGRPYVERRPILQSKIVNDIQYPIGL